MSTFPPDYIDGASVTDVPPPPYSSVPAPALPPRRGHDEGPAHPPIVRERERERPRRGMSADSSSSGGGSWRRLFTPQLAGAMGRLDLNPVNADKPLPPTPPVHPEAADARRRSAPGATWDPARGVTPPRHLRAHSHSPAAPPPVPSRPTGPPSYPPVSSYQARSLMAPRPSLHPNDPSTAQQQTTTPPRPRPEPAPVPKTSTSFRPQSLYAPNPTLTTHAPMLRRTPAPPQVPATVPPPVRVRKTSAPAPPLSQVSGSSVSSRHSRPLSMSAPPPAKATSTPMPKKLTKLVPTAPSNVSFLSPLYAAASPSKKKTSEPTSFVTTPPRRGRDFIDLTLESDDETPESEEDDSNLLVASSLGTSTSRTPPRAKGKAPGRPPNSSKPSKPRHKVAPKRPAPAPPSGSSSTSSTPPPIGPTAGVPVRCAGYTRSGQPCKRMVRARAPFLANRVGDDLGDDEDAPRAGAVGRYCRDHAGLVCAADGFYWRDGRGKAGTWIEFKDFIPADLGQQTQTLMRVTMESPLTAKDTPGFLYAYELRSLSSAETSYFKVGRSDNVPRRIGQWTKQCEKVPTLRDVFPLKATTSLKRAPSIIGSLLPGATKAGTDAARMVPAVKRWERLVHLELAERAASARPEEYDALCTPCECGTVHREIFPLAGGGEVYEQVVVDAVERWEKFVRAIAA